MAHRGEALNQEGLGYLERVSAVAFGMRWE